MNKMPKVDSIWIAAEHWVPGEWKIDNDNTDVIVTLNDKTRWAASFFTYANISTLVEKNQQTGECLSGKYFWASDMILVDEVSRARIEETIQHLLLIGEFAQIFRPADDHLYRKQNQQRELQTLLDVAAAASSSLDLNEMLTTTLDRLVDLVDASRAGVMIVNQSELEPLMLRPERPISPEDMAELLQASQAVVDSGRPLIVNPDKDRGYLEPGAFIPLRLRDRVLGLLGIIGPEGTRFDPDQVALFQSIADQLAVAVENARLYEQAEEAAAAAERNRLASELHDAVTQTLFSASLIADVLPRIWEKDAAQGQKKLAELRELTQGALAEMRTLLLELRPAALTESNLGNLMQQLIQGLSGRSRLPISLTIEGERPLPPETQIALYRIVQEALHNVIKHAAASQVMVKLTFSPQAVDLAVRDDGRGFETISPHSLGIGIMQERAEKIGANITISSQIGDGTTVTVHCPLPNNMKNNG